ncbi:Hypothetical predicted protein [Cloeon dipterum]|uniref:Uncharacterized protein n=1 Tax=Cloeon dipterum TaxID=197152 RepID=A0A8S1DQ36_9INSE|nr:Hypothetical predicted protein [Cloeon dipterum]
MKWAWQKTFAYPAYVGRSGVAEFTIKEEKLRTTNYDLLIEWDPQLDWVDMETPNLPHNAYVVDTFPEDRVYGFLYFGRAMIDGRSVYGQVRQDGILYTQTSNDTPVGLYRRFTFQILVLNVI